MLLASQGEKKMIGTRMARGEKDRFESRAAPRRRCKRICANGNDFPRLRGNRRNDTWKKRATERKPTRLAVDGIGDRRSETVGESGSVTRDPCYRPRAFLLRFNAYGSRTESPPRNYPPICCFRLGSLSVSVFEFGRSMDRPLVALDSFLFPFLYGIRAERTFRRKVSSNSVRRNE